MLNVNLLVKQKYGKLNKFLADYGMRHGTWTYKVRTGGFSFLETKKILSMLNIKFEQLEFIESARETAGEAKELPDTDYGRRSESKQGMPVKAQSMSASKIRKKPISDPTITESTFSGHSPLAALRSLKKDEITEDED